MSPTGSSSKPPILIAGAGPVGLATAAWLAHYLGAGAPGSPTIRIMDARPAPAPRTESKALVVWHRTLLALDPIVPIEKFLSAGRPLSRIVICDSGRLIGNIPLAEATLVTGHALPPAVLLSQGETERLLTDALRARGVEVERGVSLVGFTSSDDGVECELSHALPPDGSQQSGATAAGAGATGGDAAGAEVAAAGAATGAAAHGALTGEVYDGAMAAAGGGNVERCHASFLVGADGAHSAVRHGLGLPFAGNTIPRRFWMADVRVEDEGVASPGPGDTRGDTGGASQEATGGPDGVPPQVAAELSPEVTVRGDTLYLNTSPAGLAGVVPVEDGIYRIVLDAGEITPDEPRQTPTLEIIEEGLKQRTRLNIKMHDEAIWLSEFRVNERLAEAFIGGAGGNVFLAGDAAHVHSPAGGQGMNCGLQDATFLAWRLALAFKCAPQMPPTTLASYETERRPVAQSVIQLSGNMMRTALTRNPALRVLRAALLGFAMRWRALRVIFVSKLCGDDVSYESSPLVGGAGVRGVAAAPGRAFPDMLVEGRAGGLVAEGEVVGKEGKGGRRRAVELLRHSGSGTMGTLVLGPKAKSEDWPVNFGPGFPLTVRQLGMDVEGEGEGVQGLMRALGIGPEEGVLVRPDGIVAASGGPGTVREWLGRHVGGSGGNA